MSLNRDKQKRRLKRSMKKRRKQQLDKAFRNIFVKKGVLKNVL